MRWDMFKEKKTRVYWCKSCRIPVISDSSDKTAACKLCGNTAKYMCSDVRPVFPEERLFIEILIAKPFDFAKCSVWASKSGRYYIDSKSYLIPKYLYSFENAAKVREQIDKYKSDNSYEHFNLFISRFIKANKNRMDSLKYEAYSFIESAAQYIKNKNMFISFSGGKDSTVCADLVVRALANSKVVHIFGDTTLEFDITYDYVNRFIKNHPQTIFKTAKNTEQDFFEVCKDIGPPAKKMRWCCTMFKSSPISRVINALYGDKTVLSFNGIRACESSMRSKYERLTIDPKHRKIQQQITASPIFHWCDADVWNYILSENIDFNYAYRLGYNRIGCWPCPNNSRRTTFLTQIYFPKEATAWRNQLIDFAKSIGKPDSEIYVDEAKWTARQGGSSLDTASDTEITADSCTNDENAQVYLLKKPVCDEFINLFVPFGKVSRELGRKLINEVLILDIKSNVPILSIQDFNDGTGQYKVKIKTMNVKNHTDLRRKVGYQIIKYNACRSCRKCESVCSFGAISINDGHYKIDSKKCRHCQKCVTYKYIAGGCMMKKVLYVSKKGVQNNAD